MAAVATALAQGLERDAEEGQEEPPIIGAPSTNNIIFIFYNKR
jgi:hypothetical protein